MIWYDMIWYDNQIKSANLLFELYPDVQKAYNLTQVLCTIMEKLMIKIIIFPNYTNGNKLILIQIFKYNISNNN
jgi:hypothetical protein